VSQFHHTMVDSLGKEPKDINHLLMLLTKEFVRHTFGAQEFFSDLHTCRTNYKCGLNQFQLILKNC
jgi:hypothetical protein